MSVEADINLVVDVREVLPATLFPAAGASTINHYLFSSRTKLSGTTTPDAEEVSFQTLALVAGAKTIDLTALPTTSGTYDGTNKKVRAFIIKNKSGNADLTVSEGASNGYPMLGASFSFKLRGGEQALFYLGATGPTIAAADKTIDLVGTGTQESEIGIVLG